MRRDNTDIRVVSVSGRIMVCVHANLLTRKRQMATRNKREKDAIASNVDWMDLDVITQDKLFGKGGRNQNNALCTWRWEYLWWKQGNSGFLSQQT